MADKIVKIVVKSDGEFFCKLAVLLESNRRFVANGNDLGMIRTFAIVDHARASVSAKNTNSDFFHN
jgi:hypothetical protein